MKVYARILEGSARGRRTHPNWPKILTMDVYGRPATGLLEQPRLQEVVDRDRGGPLQSYDLDGFK